MQSLLLLVFILSLIYLTDSVILKSPMTDNYPQIAVLGCDSNKANLYYDAERQGWVEHLVSPCVPDEENILKFCQQVYPSLDIGNIVRLDTELRFENWCELGSRNGDNIPSCKIESQTEELVRPYRCLHANSKREEFYFPSIDCTTNSITNTGECLRAEKWRQSASLSCDKKNMFLNSSIVTLEWCDLAAFRGIEFTCCPLKNFEVKKSNENDYETRLDDDDDEDDPIQELIIVPKSSTVETHQRIIAMSLSPREPNWMQDYRRWDKDSGYFADDEDTKDDQEEIKLSSTRKSHLTLNEHKRFSKEKEEFKRKYKEQIEKLKSRWQKHQEDIQLIANSNANQAQEEYEKCEQEFRREYDNLKLTANLERTRINELHENNLDSALDIAKHETNAKLISAWIEKPLKTENIKEALYNYLHVLLRDRIHLVNRYERLRAVDPQQAKRKRVSIHERLRLIADRINDALNQLQSSSTLRSKIQPSIDNLLSEYDEVNRAAEKLLIEYTASLTSTPKPLLPLGRDENKIYPFSSGSSNNLESEYDYNTNDEYEDDDESTTTTTESNNNDQDDSGWNLDVDTDATFNLKIDSNNNNNEQNRPSYDDIRPSRPLMRGIQSNLFIPYLPYIIGTIIIVSLVLGLLIFRFIIQQRTKHRHGGNYEKNYAFTEIDSCTPEEKALHALQMNGYENPTYKFFEGQTAKC